MPVTIGSLPQYSYVVFGSLPISGGGGKMKSMGDMIQKALHHAGYVDMEPTESNLRECFRDYVDAGIWSNLSFDDEDLHEYSVNEIYRNIMRLR